MVMRTLEIKEISYKVNKDQLDTIISKLKELYGNKLEITADGDIIRVKGDLHNYKRRERIIWILSGGKHGSDVQAS
jgi:hypothetical protein